MATNWETPVRWDNDGEAPSEDLMTNGFKGGYKPPATVFNHFWNKVYRCIKQLQEEEENTRADMSTLSEAIGDKANASHTHDNYATKTEVKTLSDTVDGKANASHTHTLDNITDTTNYVRMTPAERQKLSGVSSGANAVTIDSALSSTSTNPVQNKVINSALAGKSNTSHAHDTRYYQKTEVDNLLGSHEHTLDDITDTDSYARTTAEQVAYLVELVKTIRTSSGYSVIFDTPMQSNSANGTLAFSTGSISRANGNNSVAHGAAVTVNGDCGMGFGRNVTSNGVAQTVIGKYNTEQDGATSETDATGSVFIVGNGTAATARSNAFRVTNAGKCMGVAAFMATGADYAEFYEWLDGNPDNEDRRGYFVTLDGNKIRKATADDDYVLGVVSAVPVIVGNAYTDMWQGMYMRDVFGARLTETVEVPETTNENGEIIPAHTETRFIINPEYDHTKPYVGRDERQEWATIGTHGQLVVIDDGTCEVNGYCKVAADGSATKAESKTEYRVIERIDSNHIRIVVK